MFGYDTFLVCVLDTETNGVKPTDAVLAVTTLSLMAHINKDTQDVQMFATGHNTTYFAYPPDEPVNPHALAVHGLTPDVLRQYGMMDAQNPIWPRYFRDFERDFHEFLRGPDLIVGHNISFDMRMTHVPEPFLDKTFCTMKNGHSYYKDITPEPFRGSCSLARAADLCNLSYNKDAKHDATVDTFLTAKLFQHLCKVPSCFEQLCSILYR